MFNITGLDKLRLVHGMKEQYRQGILDKAASARLGETMQVVNDADIFKKLNDTVFDLQASDFQSYKRPNKSLACLLREPVLAQINQRLTSGLLL